MEPIKFKEQNCTYAENQPEYLPLPVFKDINGIVVSCWKLSFTERIRILFNGKIWLSLMSFNKPLTPSLMSTKKSDMFISESNNNKIIKKYTELFIKLRNKFVFES